MDCNRCGAPNWSKQHECPARGKKCSNCGKPGHNAKCCRSMKKINHIAEEETKIADEDDSTANTLDTTENPIIDKKHQEWTTTLYDDGIG